MDKLIYNKKSINGEIILNGDKSISHRAAIIGSIAKGVTIINNFLKCEDCINTIKCLKTLGTNIKLKNDKLIIKSEGLYNFKKPNKTLYVGNSGTTIKILTGLLSGQNFSSKITGDSSIKKRPVDRVINPLNKMGANIKSKNKKYPPIFIKKGNITNINYTLPIPSAQVKSAILISSLYGMGKTVIEEKIKSRNHTEIMLAYFGANIKIDNNKIILIPNKTLYGKEITIPGDISSASFFIVATLICKNSYLLIKNVGLNNTRTGIIKVLKNMGANIKVKNIYKINNELVGNIEVKTSILNSTKIQGDIIPTLIDEIPIICVAALFAKGTTIIKNIEELKFKETNRIKTIVSELKKLNAKIEETKDGIKIEGNNLLYGNKVKSYDDHRIAMSLVIASLKTNGYTYIEGIDCINTSFPNFFNILDKL